MSPNSNALDKKCDLAIRFETNGYAVSGDTLHGRQMAGNNFLEAAAKATNPETNFLYCYSKHPKTLTDFNKLIAQFSPNLEGRHCSLLSNQKLAGASMVYLPDPNLAEHANYRLHSDVSSYSLCGVTHTTATHAAMGMLASLATAPVMPWDALICTSPSVRSTAETILAEQQDYLSWRMQSDVKPFACQLPIIPLGIHNDYYNNLPAKNRSRKALNIRQEETVFLYVGRLSPWVKANPYPMYKGLQDAAKKTGRPIRLIECGWYENDMGRDAMAEGRKLLMPDVRYSHVDGRDFVARDKAWAAADVFVSMSDNVQETFGLTPVEAQAAGMPVLITDWDGYKDLMTDGAEGYRIETSFTDDTDSTAFAFETGTLHYGHYCAMASQLTSVNVPQFTDRAVKLILDPALRKAMGMKGRKNARQRFEWFDIFKQYQNLWAELTDIRRHAASNSDHQKIVKAAPKCSPARLPPSKVFSTYPTQFITNDSHIAVLGDNALESFKKLSGVKLLTLSNLQQPPVEFISKMFQFIQTSGPEQSRTIVDIAAESGTSAVRIKMIIAQLAKKGLVSITNP